MFTISGPSGELRHAYAVAARLGPWTITHGRLTAPVRSANPVYVSRAPLDLVLDFGTKRVKASAVAAQITGGRCSITLEPGRWEVV